MPDLWSEEPHSASFVTRTHDTAWRCGYPASLATADSPAARSSLALATMTGVHTARFAVIDTETTGLDVHGDRVVSIAVVSVDRGVVRRDLAEQVLVDPGIPIPPASTAIHGITADDVVGAVDLDTALQHLAPALADRVLVGHHLAFDLAFLARSGYQAAETLDTLAVSRLLWPARGTRHTLDALAERVGVLPLDRHTALGDAVATAEALAACLPLLAQRGLDTPQAVARASRAQRRGRARVRRSTRRRSIRPRRSRRPRGRMGQRRSGPRRR